MTAARKAGKLKRQHESRSLATLHLLLLVSIMSGYDSTTWRTVTTNMYERKRPRVSKESLTDQTLNDVRQYATRQQLDRATADLLRNPSTSKHVKCWHNALNLVLGNLMLERIRHLNTLRGVVPGHAFVTEIKQSFVDTLLARVPESVRPSVKVTTQPKHIHAWLQYWRKQHNLKIGATTAKAWINHEMQTRKVNQRRIRRYPMWEPGGTQKWHLQRWDGQPESCILLRFRVLCTHIWYINKYLFWEPPGSQNRYIRKDTFSVF